ncbi:MAG: hypothetical protein KatS3mg111_2298 [Pirellulaceae bacterium]|nr:MAG: hypothetical protein KatS3mg111_2298 [Pirellulaceae bacterium]
MDVVPSPLKAMNRGLVEKDSPAASTSLLLDRNRIESAPDTIGAVFPPTICRRPPGLRCRHRACQNPQHVAMRFLPCTGARLRRLSRSGRVARQAVPEPCPWTSPLCASPCIRAGSVSYACPCRVGPPRSRPPRSRPPRSRPPRSHYSRPSQGEGGGQRRGEASASAQDQHGSRKNKLVREMGAAWGARRGGSEFRRRLKLYRPAFLPQGMINRSFTGKVSSG